MKDILYNQIKEIGDESIRNFVRQALDNAPEGFWKDASSASGKYHPLENQGTGGIIRHTIKCAVLTKDLLRFVNLSEKEKDIILASVILHDIKKHGEPWGEHTSTEHGKIAADFLDQFELK